VTAGRRIDSRADLDRNFALAKSWWEKCRNEHSECNGHASLKEIGKILLPTRLTSVGDEASAIKPFLYVTWEDERGAYFALSHRWGNTDTLTTTAESLPFRQAQIPLSTMSETFKDTLTDREKI
jgi:hypothetical protein